jgi:phosphoglycerate kinase
MAYTFAKAQGGHVGNSLCEDDMLELANDTIAKAKANHVNLVLPTDSVIADKFAADAATQVCDNDVIPDGWLGLDLGPKAVNQMTQVIKDSKTILWNGPAGVFEMEAFAAGTKAIAEAIVAATQKGAFSLIGGGDSVAAINQLGLANQVSYVSTGGGALLEMIEGKVLPGVEAIRGY